MSEEIKEQDLCRCCHSEGTFICLFFGDDTTDEGEIAYADMLRSCFDIELNPVGTRASVYTICEECIVRLRDAHTFKQQVLKCEEHFQKKIIEVKVEIQEAEIQKAEIQEENSIPTPTADCNVPDDKEYIEEVPNSDFDLESDDGLDSEPFLSEPEEQKKPKKKKYKRKPTPRIKTGRLPQSSYTVQIGDSYKCIDCDVKCATSPEILAHYKTVHLKTKPRIQCKRCPMKFQSIILRVKHTLQEHGIDERVTCNACAKKFNKKEQLSLHINSYHMLGKVYKCAKCDFECYSHRALLQHRVKHKPKTLSCKFCKKLFLRKTNLVVHERIHTGDKRKKCEECGEAFVQKASLNYHMAKYHPEVKF